LAALFAPLEQAAVLARISLNLPLGRVNRRRASERVNFAALAPVSHADRTGVQKISRLPNGSLIDMSS